ncbi:response regulator [Salinimicrobium sp. CAU 1759]
MVKESRVQDEMSILVVEDNLGDFILIEDYLIEIYNTVSITQYSEFQLVCDYFNREDCNCDIILLDLHLPDMSGLELVKSIINKCPKTPIIILTGYTDLPLAKQSLEMGIYDFLVKDEINSTLLYKSIEFAISRSNYVSHIERQNENLKSIAWKQSHLVRAPLANILGIINMIENEEKECQNLSFWLEHLKIASNEMDEIIHNIVKEAEDLISEK